MKVLAYFSLVIVAVNAVSKEYKTAVIEQFTAVGETCSEQTKASASDIASLMAHRVPDTKEGKCFIHCFYEQFNMQNKDGTLNKEGAQKTLAGLKIDDPDFYDKIMELYDVCAAQIKISSDPCDTAKDFFNCGVIEGNARGINLDLTDM